MRLHMRARHAAVALAVIVLAALTGFGCIGPAVGVERIHAYETTAIIKEDRTVEIREVIDWDFGGDERHGIFREIPNDAGLVTDISVESPTAPDQFTDQISGPYTEIRIGDPDRTISGRHRYVITYVLPAPFKGNRFSLDAIGGEFPVPIETATVQVLGADLERTDCRMGVYGTTEQCELTLGEGEISTTVTDLEANEAVTVAGDLTEGATRAAEMPDLPPFEDRDDGTRLTWALIVAGIGTAVGVAVFVVSRQVGRNEVAAGGATEAAFVPYGDETFGPDHHPPDQPPPPLPGSRKVADSQMGELAGI